MIEKCKIFGVVHTKYYLDDQIKKNETRRACGTYGDRRIVYRVLEGKPEEKRPLAKHRLKLEDNIEMDLKEIG